MKSGGVAAAIINPLSILMQVSGPTNAVQGGFHIQPHVVILIHAGLNHHHWSGLLCVLLELKNSFLSYSLPAV
jgi:hypothetical protein